MSKKPSNWYAKHEHDVLSCAWEEEVVRDDALFMEFRWEFLHYTNNSKAIVCVCSSDLIFCFF